VAIECAQCGVRAELEAPFLKVRKSLSRKHLAFCPRCVQQQKLEASKESEYTVLAALVACAAGAWWIGSNILLFLALFCVAYAPALLLHELGHADAARVLGLRCFGIVIGFGTPLWRGHLLGVPIEWRRNAVGGYTRGAILSERGARRRMALFALGGPALNALAAALVWPALPDGGLSSAPSGFGEALASGWFAANALYAGLNLLPLRHSNPLGVLASDGLLILQSLFATPATVREWLAARFLLEAAIAHEEGRFEPALASVRAGLGAHPGHPGLTSLLGICLLGTNQIEEARDVFRRQLAGELQPAERAMTLNNVAWCDFVSARDERLDEALQCSEEACAQIGWLSPIQNTRAAVLVWAERAEEALPFALAALEGPLPPANRAYVACVLALAHAALGRRDEAKRALEQARAADATCLLLPRAAASVG
jgi:tetratricopeptide (TPR) repeat protein